MNIALKEWASVIAAVESGVQICLLRKGGIIEADRGGFLLRYRRFLLFPTYAHEHTLLLRDPFKSLVQEPEDNSHLISLVCDVTDVVTAPSQEALFTASPCFVWNETFIRKRLEYKPHLPLYAILLRARRLPSPVRISDRPSYAGCKSWVHLTPDIDAVGAEPVLTDAQYEERRSVLLGALQQDMAVR